MTRFITGFLLLCALLLATPEAAHAQLIPGNSQLRTLLHGGLSRNYRVLVPPSANSNSAILIALHGGQGTAQIMENMTGFSDLAKQHGFVAVYPQGVFGTWNAGNCCGYALGLGVDDGAFIEAVIADVRTRNGINGPVYVTGISNGGMLTYYLGCTRANIISGIAPVAATLTMGKPVNDPNPPPYDAHNYCQPSAPVSFMQVHGLEDQHVLFDGGFPTAGFQQNDYRLAVNLALDVFNDSNNCSGNHPQPLKANRLATEIVDTSSAGCTLPVRLVTLKTAGHVWPGHTGSFAGIVDPAYPGYAASLEIARFFGLAP